MAINPQPRVRSSRPDQDQNDLLLRELNHRCTNDLQMVVALLAMQSRHAQSGEARAALMDAQERVAILARSRASLHGDQSASLETALQQICAALQVQAEPWKILISLTVETECDGLSPRQISVVALMVNELTTNAIKHAFEDGNGGHIHIAVRNRDAHEITIIVDDDGTPFRKPDGDDKRRGLGLDLVTRLMGSVGGLLIPPANGSKSFEMRIPRALNEK